MRNLIKSEKIGNFTFNLAYDEYADSPEAWGDEDAFLGAVNTRNCNFGRKNWGKNFALYHIPFGEGPWLFDNPDMEMAENVDSEQELQEAWAGCFDPSIEVFPVEYMDYGCNGGRLRECDHHNADGYIFICVPWRSEIEKLAHADFDVQAIKDALLKEWNQYLSGEVYTAAICDNTGDFVDSCGGFYGEETAWEWAQEMIDSLEKQSREVRVVVTHGTLPLEFPCRVQAEFEAIQVPMWIGCEDVCRWALEEGPFRENKDILSIHIYTPTCSTQAAK